MTDRPTKEQEAQAVVNETLSQWVGDLATEMDRRIRALRREHGSTEATEVAALLAVPEDEKA
jgi:hypothetical protein